jgi:hypothetical protein
MQAFDSPLRSSIPDGLGNLRVELRPVIEGAYLQESDERVQLVNIVLHRCPRKAPSVLALKGAATLSHLRLLIFDVMGLVFAKISIVWSMFFVITDVPSTMRQYFSRKSASFVLLGLAVVFCLFFCKYFRMSSSSESSSESDSSFFDFFPLLSSFAVPRYVPCSDATML